MARFYNYERDKEYWFLVYLQLGEAISKFPSMSAKNVDFKETMESYLAGELQKEWTKKYAYDKK